MNQFNNRTNLQKRYFIPMMNKTYSSIITELKTQQHEIKEFPKQGNNM